MLVQLNLGQNELAELPPEIGFLSSLEVLDVNRNLLTGVPDTLSELTELKYALPFETLLPRSPSVHARISDVQGNQP